MDNLLKKLNSPKALLIALVLVLLVNGFLFYYFRLSAPSDRALEPPGSQLVEDAANISFSDEEGASDDETDGSDGEEVAPLEAVGAATNIPLPGTAKFDEPESSGSDSAGSSSEEESILGNVLGGGGSGAAPALTPGFGTTAAPSAPVPEPANDEESIPREIAGTVLAPVTSVSPVGPASNEQPENQGLFETATAALEPISQGAAPVPIPDFFVPDSSYIEPAPATPVPDFLIPDFIEAPVPATPVPDFFVPDSSYIEPAAPEVTEDTSEQSPLPPVEPSPLPPVEPSPPPPSVGQPPPSGSQQPPPPPSGSQQPAGYQQPPPSGSQPPTGYQQPLPSGAQ